MAWISHICPRQQQSSSTRQRGTVAPSQNALLPRLRFGLIVFATLLLPLITLADDLKWRAPRVGAATPVAQHTIPPPSGIPIAQQAAEPFRPPSVELPAVAPSTLPPEIIAPVPPTYPTDSFDPLGYFFEHADDTLPVIEEWEASCQPLISPIMPSKPGLFQKFGISGTWTEGGTSDREPAVTDFSTYTTFAVPLPIREWPLYITPGYDMRFLDGPASPDLPPILYDAYVDFTWNLRITQRSTQVLSIAPGYYSDFQQGSGDAFRFTAKWVSTYDVVKHRITLITGSIYLNREDISLLPIVGLLITPNDWSRFEAVFPTPRASLRLRSTEFYEDWLYAGADLYGGQTWSIERPDGSLDQLTMLESKAVLGYERRRQGGAGWHLESGWVFDRDVRFRNTPEADFTPDPTYYVRAGLTF